MLCFVMPQVIKIQPRTALVIVNVFLCRTGGKTILYRANMCKTISVRVSDDLYARVNELLGHTCFNLSWLVRLYLVYLTEFYDSLPIVSELRDTAEHVAQVNNFFTTEE